MRWVTLMVGVVLVTTGCTEGLGQAAGQELAEAMDELLTSGAEAEGVVARRLFSGEEIYAPWISTYSPDGRFQAFTDWGSGDGDLAIRELATGTIRYLTLGGTPPLGRGFAMGNRFSSGGDRVAFGWWQDDHYVLGVVGTDGSDPEIVFDPRQREADEVILYDWSSDDRKLLVGLVTWEEPTPSGWEGMGYELVTVSLVDGSVDVLIPFSEGERIPYGRAFFAPDGRTVAFSTVLRGSAGLADAYVLDIESGRRTVLLGSPAEEQLLGWSSDGGHLYVLSERGGSPSLWAIPVRDGEGAGQPVLLRGDVYGFASGHVSGGRLLYHVVSESPELFQVEVDPEGGGALSEPSKVVTGGSFWDGERAAWSPDGESLAYTRGDPGRVVVQAARGGNHVQVFDLPAGYTGVYSLRWSPDSRSIVVSAKSLGSQGTSRMLTLRLDSGRFEPGPVNPAEGRPVTHDLRTVYKTDWGGMESIGLDRPDKHYVWEATEDAPTTGANGCAWGREAIALSPSDDRLAVTANSGQSGCIGIVSTEGGALDWIYRSAQGEVLAGIEWSADGSSLHFAVRPVDPMGEVGSMSEIRSVPASGGPARKILEYRNIVAASGWTVHPDGDRLVFRAGEEKYELWVMEGLEEALAGR